MQWSPEVRVLRAPSRTFRELAAAPPASQSWLARPAARAPVAAIGSSDFHGLGPMGLCRTFVFATEASEQGVVDAVRAHRTVVFGRDGQVYGDPTLTQYADRLRDRLPASDSHGNALDWISRLTALAGFAGLVLM